MRRKTASRAAQSGSPFPGDGLGAHAACRRLDDCRFLGRGELGVQAVPVGRGGIGQLKQLGMALHDPEYYPAHPVAVRRHTLPLGFGILGGPDPDPDPGTQRAAVGVEQGTQVRQLPSEPERLVAR
jgi:hypothetical protein